MTQNLQNDIMYPRPGIQYGRRIVRDAIQATIQKFRHNPQALQQMFATNIRYGSYVSMTQDILQTEFPELLPVYNKLLLLS